MQEPKPSDQYLTPPKIADCVRYFFGGAVDYDPYGHPQQLVQAENLRTWETRDQPFMSGVKKVWCNPPFSGVKNIVPELSTRSFAGKFDCVTLVPANVCSAYWVDSIWKLHHVAAIGMMKRYAFCRPGPHGPEATKHVIRNDTALVYFCPDLSHPEGDRARAHEKVQHFKTAFTSVCRTIIRPQLA